MVYIHKLLFDSTHKNGAILDKGRRELLRALPPQEWSRMEVMNSVSPRGVLGPLPNCPIANIELANAGLTAEAFRSNFHQDDC